MQRYTHVIWDWNGTLLDDVALSVSTINGLLAEHGLPAIDASRYREVFDFPVREYYSRLGFELDDERFHTLATAWLSRYMAAFDTCRLRPDALSAIAALSERGVDQSVLSATEQTRLEQQVMHHGVAKHFRGCVGIENHLAHGKLERARAWLEEIATDAASVLLVGDTTHDLEVAEALGADCILVSGGHHHEPKLRATGTARVVPNLLAVVGCL